MVDDVVSTHRMAAERAGVTLEVDMPATPVRVIGSDRALVRVLSNLVANAIAHTPAGGSVRLAVGADAEGPGRGWTTPGGESMPPICQVFDVAPPGIPSPRSAVGFLTAQRVGSGAGDRCRAGPRPPRIAVGAQPRPRGPVRGSAADRGGRLRRTRVRSAASQRAASSRRLVPGSCSEPTVRSTTVALAPTVRFHRCPELSSPKNAVTVEGRPSLCRWPGSPVAGVGRVDGGLEDGGSGTRRCACRRTLFLRECDDRASSTETLSHRFDHRWQLAQTAPFDRDDAHHADGGTNGRPVHEIRPRHETAGENRPEGEDIDPGGVVTHNQDPGRLRIRLPD